MMRAYPTKHARPFVRWNVLASSVAVAMLVGSIISHVTAFPMSTTVKPPRLVVKFGGSATATRLWSSSSETSSSAAKATPIALKQKVLDLLSSTPANAPTDRSLTESILRVVRRMEEACPTSNADVVAKLAGNWELLWTTQDRTSPEFNQGPLRTWINPLENQSYSNNPNGQEEGRLNPVLPRPIQDQLEKVGLIRKDTEIEAIRSSQSIDLTRRRVRNVVTFGIPSLPFATSSPRRASLTVDVGFEPSPTDPRKVDVKFEACRVVVPKSPIDFTIPLGIIGPTGWLKTNYIDDTMRITRGHKGSVFILTRPGATTPTTNGSNQ